MEPKKLIFVPLLFAALALQAQVMPITVARTGFVRAQGNLAGGYLFSQKNYTAYLAGDMDVYVSERVSVTGDLWYSFATNDGALRQNHAIFGGLNFHPVRHSRWDPYIGFSPGVGLAKVNYATADARQTSPLTPLPLVSVATGCNWYVGSIFHLFIKVRWVNGQVVGDAPFRTSLHELKITGGLGWNLRVWKPKRRAGV